VEITAMETKSEKDDHLQTLNNKSLLSNILFLPFLLLLLSFIFFLINFNDPLNNYDEGITVYGAYRVLNGEVPYRDFWTLYAPGQFYILAGLFKVFGASILVERLWDTFVRSILSIIVFLIVRKLTSQTIAIFSWFATVLWLSFFGCYGYNAFPSLFLILVSVFSLISFLFSSKGQLFIWIIVSGLSVGIATLFRHDLGLYTFIAEILWLVIFSLSHITSTDRSSIRFIFYYSLSVVTISLPPTLYFMNNVPLYDLAYDLVIFPATIFPRVRSLPYPTPFPNPLPIFTGDLSFLSWMGLIICGIPFYFPWLVYALGIVIVVTRIRKEHLVDKNIWAIMLLVLVGLGSFNQTRIRSDLPHLIPVFLPALILIFPLLHYWSIKKRSIVLLVTFACVSILILPICSTIHKAYSTIISSSVISHGIERASHFYVNPYQVMAIKYVQDYVHKGELIYVGNYRHDTIIINDVMFYFLSERNSATKYNELSPGSATTISVQQEIVEELKHNRVAYIVLNSSYEAKEPNESSVSSGVRLLDDFIINNYQITKQFGPYAIWKKR
jgi:hypothetical protein